jgi:hypothetical protein
MLTEYLQYRLKAHFSNCTENIVASYFNFQNLFNIKKTYKPNVSAFEYTKSRGAED